MLPLTVVFFIGSVHKRGPQSREEVCSVRMFCEQGGEGCSSDADVGTFWCKNFGFLEIYGVPARTRGEVWANAVRTFFGQRGVVDFFAILCGHLLWSGRPLTILLINKPLTTEMNKAVVIDVSIILMRIWKIQQNKLTITTLTCDVIT